MYHLRKIKVLLATYMLACASLWAQDTKIAISSATANSYHNDDHAAAKAIDGDFTTIWHSNWDNIPTFPVTFTIKLKQASHVDYVRYTPRPSGTNGNWKVVDVSYCSTTYGTTFTNSVTYDLKGASSTFDFPIGANCGQINFTIYPGATDNGKNLASAAEIAAYAYDTTKPAAFAQYFNGDVYSELKPGVTSSDDIADADVKALVEAMLAGAEGYKKFRVGEYEPYMTTATVRNNLKTNSLYNNYENPTGIYLKRGESCIIAVSGIDKYPVGLKIKDWYKSGDLSSYSLHNGLNYITATTEGNVFVDYYTDDFEKAPNVQMHFINAPVLGYWDKATMTNDDWVSMLAGPLAEDDVIIITRSEHAQTAYPVKQWKQYCPDNVDATMTHYQDVQWALRDIMGLEKFNRQVKNRQLFYADKSGSMYAGGDASVCGYGDLRVLVTPDAENFDFWGVGHEWGHNNQMPGFHWSGCGETTNNIPAAWAQFKFKGNRDDNGPISLRLEDEKTGINDYSGMRGGRMQTYFEEGLRKGVAWQLQDGPDYHNATPEIKTVENFDADGNSIGQVTTTSRNYDHFVKLSPFWQLQLWGTVAEKNPKIITKVIERIRATENYTATYNTNGKQQINWMKLACDAAQINLLPFFEKAGMLRPIHAYIEDYNKGWNIITEEMINELKTYVANQGYPNYTEEINYINGHNYHIYRDNLALNVTGMQGELNGNKVKILHSVAQNAVAFETYNIKNELIRITMYGLGSDDAHSFTQVLYPSSYDEKENAAYIMAVGYDGTRRRVYQTYANEDEARYGELGRLLLGVEAMQQLSDETLTKVGYYKLSALTDLNAAYATAKTVYDNQESASYETVYDDLYAEYEKVQNDEYARVGIVEGYAYRLINKAYSNLSMAVDVNNDQMFALTTTDDNKQKWYFEASDTEGRYYLKNKATGKYPGDVSTGSPLKADKEESSKGGKEGARAYELRDMGNGVWALVGATGLHCSSSQSYNIVGWSTDADATQWYITAVETNKDAEALHNLQSLLAQTEALINKIGVVSESTNTEKILLTENSYYCNALCLRTEWDKFSSYIVLCDNRTDTHLHTDYSGDDSEDGQNHYIRMDVGNGNAVRKFKINYITRNSSNPIPPTSITIAGSNDENGPWTVIEEDVTSGLPTASNKTYTSPIWGNGIKYRYIRFMVNSSSKLAGGHYCFALSELGISKVTYNVEYLNDNYASIDQKTLIDAYEAWLSAKTVVATNTKEEYVRACSDLQEKYEALSAVCGKSYTISTNVAGGGVTFEGGEPCVGGGTLTVPASLTLDELKAKLKAIDLNGYVAQPITINENVITVIYNKVYSVYINGGEGEGRITFNGTAYENEGTFNVQQGSFTVTELKASDVEGYTKSAVAVDHETGNISVTYTLDTSALNDLLERTLNLIITCQGFVNSQFVTESLMSETNTAWTTAQNALETVQTRSELNDAVSALQAAYNKLDAAKNQAMAEAEERAELKEQLNTLIGETETLITSCYENDALKYVNSDYVTEISIAEIRSAIETAQAKCNSNGTTESEYNASLETLGQMKENLATAIENANNEAAVRDEKRAELNTLIAAANDLITLCGTTPGDATETLIEEVRTAIGTAQTVANNKGSTLDELTTATEALQAKYDVLAAAQQSTAKAELRVLIAQAEALIAECGTYGNGQHEEKETLTLQTGDENENFWLSTNADQNVVGSSTDGDGIAALIDGNVDTYMHTQWGGTAVSDDHYVQVSLGDGQGLEEFTFTYATRKGSSSTYTSPAPTIIELYGSNDGVTFTDLIAKFTSSDATNPLISFTKLGEFWESANIRPTQSYDYLRFYVKESRGPQANTQYGGHYYFAMSEFALKSVSYEASYYVESLTSYGNVTEEQFLNVARAKDAAVALANSSYDKATLETAAATLQAVYDILWAAHNDYSYLPVTLTAEVESPVLYMLNSKRGNNKLLQYAPAEGHMFGIVDATIVDEEVEANLKQLFYFTKGSVKGQVYVHPFAAGGKVLAASNKEYGANKVSVAEKSAAEAMQWTFDQETIEDVVWYSLKGVGASYFSHYGGGSNKMGFYGSKDDGSRLRFTDFDETTIEGSYAYHTLKLYYDDATRSVSEDIVGYYRGTEDYATAYDNASAVLADQNSTDADYLEAYNTLLAENEVLEMILPVEGKFYRIISADSKNGREGGIVYADPADNKLYWDKSKAASDATAIWTIVPATNDFFNIANLHTGTYMSGFVNRQPSPLNEVAGNISLVSLSDDGQMGIKCNGAMMHAQAGGAIVSYSSGANDASAWRIEEVDMTNVKHTVSIGEFEHASLYLNYAVTIPNDVKAYYIDGNNIEIDNEGVGTLTLTKLEGNVLPAQTAVILYAPEREYSFAYTDQATDEVSDNLLKGSAYQTYREAEGNHKYYVFGQNNGEVGLYKNGVKFDAEGAEGTTHYKMFANKVLFDWNENPSGQLLQVRSFRFRFNSPTTDIENIVVEGSMIYDIYGRRILDVKVPGLYIVDGVKRYIQVK